MTPRERILTALDHRQTERAPFSWGFGPTPEMTGVLNRFLAERGIAWEKLRLETDDKCRMDPLYIGKKLPERADIWGIRRKPVSYGAGSYHEFEHFPLAGVETVAELDRHPWPRAEDFDYAGLQARASTLNPNRFRALCVFGGHPFEIYCWMTGLEESLVNLKIRPELVTAALERITLFYEAQIRRTMEQIGEQMDILFIADDLGGQNGLLLSRESYRAIIQPFHRRLACAAREKASRVKVMFHSDGAVFEVVPDLMEAGVDILEAVQTDAAGMDPQRLKSAYGDRLCFHGGISVQKLLPHSDTAFVETECRRLTRILGANGGYIAAPTHAIQMGTPPENVLAMLRAVLGPDDYAAAMEAARI